MQYSKQIFSLISSFTKSSNVVFGLEDGFGMEMSGFEGKKCEGEVV